MQHFLILIEYGIAMYNLLQIRRICFNLSFPELSIFLQEELNIFATKVDILISYICMNTSDIFP